MEKKKDPILGSGCSALESASAHMALPASFPRHTVFLPHSAPRVLGSSHTHWSAPMKWLHKECPWQGISQEMASPSLPLSRFKAGANVWQLSVDAFPGTTEEDFQQILQAWYVLSIPH